MGIPIYMWCHFWYNWGPFSPTKTTTWQMHYWPPYKSLYSEWPMQNQQNSPSTTLNNSGRYLWLQRYNNPPWYIQRNLPSCLDSIMASSTFNTQIPPTVETCMLHYTESPHYTPSRPLVHNTSTVEMECHPWLLPHHYWWWMLSQSPRSLEKSPHPSPSNNSHIS